MAKNEILWMTPKWPLPAQDGARVATKTLLSHMTKSGWEADLLALSGTDEKPSLEEAQKQLNIRAAHIVYREINPKSFILLIFKLLAHLVIRPFIPLTMRFFYTNRVRNEVRSIFESTSCDTLLYDGLHQAIHQASWSGIYQRPQQFSSVVYRAHNCEADIWFRKSQSTRNPIMKGFYHFQACCIRRFERSLILNSNLVATVSEDDIRQFKRWPGAQERNHFISIPIGYRFDKQAVTPKATQTHQVMFLGRLDWPPNKEGLKWLLEKVWPEVVQRRSEITI